MYCVREIRYILWLPDFLRCFPGHTLMAGGNIIKEEDLMKKTLALLLMLLLCAGLVLTACGGGSSSAAAPAPAAAEAVDEEEYVEEEDVEEGDVEEEAVDEEVDVDVQMQADVEKLTPLFSEAYIGTGTEGTDMILLLGPDNMAALAFSSDGLSASFVGDYAWEDDTTMTIVDDKTGLSITFEVVKEDDGYWLLVEDVGEDIFAEPMPLDTGVFALVEISYETEAVA